MRFSNIISSVSPPSHSILKKEFIPQDTFDPLDICIDEIQCIPKKNSKSKVHRVETNDLNHVHQAKDGTRIIDAYVNLDLRDGDTSDAAAAAAATANETTTLFIQYKHGKFETTNKKVKISEMNCSVTKLFIRTRQQVGEEPSLDLPMGHQPPNRQRYSPS